ncbi:MAG: hypothetical protein F6K31_35865 [Symploca sp. SIO2G7]|nr:hypothetical protein [Symploca sp. SIO2G7]
MKWVILSLNPPLQIYGILGPIPNSQFTIHNSQFTILNSQFLFNLRQLLLHQRMLR